MLYRLAISLTRQQKRLTLLGIDVVLIAVAHVVSASLLLGQDLVVALQDNLLTGSVILMTVGTTLTVLLGLHKIKLNAYQMQGILDSAFVAAVITIAGVFYALLATPPTFPASLYVVTGMVFLILSVSSRLFLRQALLKIYQKGNPRVPIIIYGAGQTGQQLAAALAVDDTVEAIGFIDDDRRLQSLTIAGLRVHAPVEIDDMIERHDVRRIILAMPATKRAVQTAISRRLAQTGCEVHALPSFADLITDNADSLSDTKPVDFDDLLGREQLEQELPGVSSSYHDRNVLVTGAGGSIGSELCRQIIGCQPRKLILLDHSELALYDIHRELSALSPQTPIIPILGSVCERGLVIDAMESNDVDIVLHAAAYKHVALVEENPLEGIRVNVLGTKTVADAARLTGVERFILLSTDKAVRPSSKMGASKRLAEMCVQDLASRSTTTRFSMVRFGNVLGSSGSVIPLFQEQIANGGPVTLTHSDVTRFFMTIPEAVRLVLLAGSFARGGDVFVLDMGKSLPIRDLAAKMIDNAGYSIRDADNPDGEIEIEITGLRPGEKMHEEFLIGSDMLTTPHAKILRAQETHLSEIEMANALQTLRIALETRNKDLLQKTLDKWIERQNDGTITEQSVNL